MSRHCTICTHAERLAIDREVLSGTSFRDIARRFGRLSPAGVHRHKAHIHRAVTAVADADPVTYGRTILAQARALNGRAVSLLDRAEGDGDLRAAVGAIREARACLELVGRLQGQIVERHAHLHAHVGILGAANPNEIVKTLTPEEVAIAREGARRRILGLDVMLGEDDGEEKAPTVDEDERALLG